MSNLPAALPDSFEIDDHIDGCVLAVAHGGRYCENAFGNPMNRPSLHGRWDSYPKGSYDELLETPKSVPLRPW